MTRWYLAKCRPNQDSWLIASLTGLGIEVYSPTITRLRRGKTLSEALFPTYVFCKMDENFLDDASIRWAAGLNYFLGLDGAPSVVPNSVMSYLQNAVDLWNSEGHASDTSESDETTAQHDEAEKPLSIMFERYINARRRCRILFQAIGALTAIEVDDSSVPITPAY